MIPAEKKLLKISKLDAAKRQLECAIILYFNECDSVSIHTLCMAANEVLHDLNSGRVWMIKDNLSNHVIPGMEKKAREIYNKAGNFFKHANRDPNDILDFDPDSSEIIIWEGCNVYRKLTGESPDKMIAYNIWFKTKYDQVFIYTEEEKKLTEHYKLVLNGMSKQNYYEWMLSALNRITT